MARNGAKPGRGLAQATPRGVPVLQPSLRSLAWPLSSAEFFEAYWQKRPFVSHGGKQRLARLERDLGTLSVAALAGRCGSARAYFFGPGAEDFRAIDIRPADAAALYDAGMTVYFRDVAPLLPWADALAGELGMKGRGLAVAFASRAGSRVKFHFDYPEVFTIQLRGRKRWRVAPNRHVANPVTKSVAGTSPPESLRFYCQDELPAAGPTSWETLELEPGSVLHLPAGYWHATEAIEDSLSVAFTPPPDTWADLVIDGIRSLLLSRDEWRERAVGTWGNELQRARARRRLGALMAGLDEELERLRPEDLVAPPRARPPALSRRYRRNPTATFGVEAATPGGTGDAALVRFIRKDLRELQETEVEVGRPSLELCRWIHARREPFAAEEACAAAPTVAVADVLSLLELLLQVGLIREGRKDHPRRART